MAKVLAVRRLEEEATLGDSGFVAGAAAVARAGATVLEPMPDGSAVDAAGLTPPARGNLVALVATWRRSVGEADGGGVEAAVGFVLVAAVEVAVVPNLLETREPPLTCELIIE